MHRRRSRDNDTARFNQTRARRSQRRLDQIEPGPRRQIVGQPGEIVGRQHFQANRGLAAGRGMRKHLERHIRPTGTRPIGTGQDPAPCIKDSEKIEADVFLAGGQHLAERDIACLPRNQAAQTLRIGQTDRRLRRLALDMLQLAMRHGQIADHLVGQQAIEIVVTQPEEDAAKHRDGKNGQKSQHPQTALERT